MKIREKQISSTEMKEITDQIKQKIKSVFGIFRHQIEKNLKAQTTLMIKKYH